MQSMPNNMQAGGDTCPAGPLDIAESLLNSPRRCGRLRIPDSFFSSSSLNSPVVVDGCVFLNPSSLFSPLNRASMLLSAAVSISFYLLLSLKISQEVQCRTSSATSVPSALVIRVVYGCMHSDYLQRCDLLPNVICYSSGISACEKGGPWQLAFGLLLGRRHNYLLPNVMNDNSAIGACEKCGPRQPAPGLLAGMRAQCFAAQRYQQQFRQERT